MTASRKIQTAQITWRDDDTPFDSAHDDIFFAGDGLAETRHVFIDGNNLRTRFEDTRQITIAELGFGSGLNFLSAWDAWRREKRCENASLHFFSVEAAPWTVDDLTRAHVRWPELNSLSTHLRDRYPPAFGGAHHIPFPDGVTLTLFFGNADDALRDMTINADAWFLDGFAPSKNPEMWSTELMSLVAAQSKPGATIATFTVAGSVRRALTNAGFSVAKIKGFGAKREMLTGQLMAPSVQTKSETPWYDMPRGKEPPNGGVAIIGAGVAGAALCNALRRSGLSSVIFDPAGPAAGASGNVAGLIMPRVDADFTPIARFHIDAYLHMVRLLNAFPEEIFHQCGAVLKPANDTERRRFEKISALAPLPAGWMEFREGNLIFPQAGVVDPRKLVSSLIGDTTIIRKRVTGLTRNADGWSVETKNSFEQFDTVVIANGANALDFLSMRPLPLGASCGQMEHFPDVPSPETITVSGAYGAPAPPFSDPTGLVIGATYDPATPGEKTAPDRAATRRNIENASAALSAEFQRLNGDHAQSRASIRCVVPDQTPVAGPVPDWRFYAGAYDGLRDGRIEEYPPAQYQPGLYALTGLGSRGLVTAPLAAAHLASQIAHAPAPVSRDIANALHVGRFFIRALKRSKSGAP